MRHEPRRRRPTTRRLVASYLFVSAALFANGCSTVPTQGPSLVPSTFRTRTGPFAVFADAPVAADAPVVRNLQDLERDVDATLGLRVNEEAPAVEVYILNSREAFNHFLTFYYPELPPRRAFFLAQGSRRVIYTYYNDRLDEDLRHEATHALLNVAVGDLPLWLDEGLAEYFEGPGGRAGLNPDHVARLPEDEKAGWKPDLARLETLANVREMTPRDYRESWAWVHYLLNGPPAGKKTLLAYIADPHPVQGPTTLADRLAAADAEGDDGPKMLAHLADLRARPVADTTPVASKPMTPAPSIHLQDSPIERASTVQVAPRRGFFDRLFTAMGFR